VCVYRQTQEAKVDSPIIQSINLTWRWHVVKVQLQSRVLDSKLSDDIWQDLRDDRRYEANSQLANITLLGATSDAERSLSLIERSLGLREKKSTDFRQTHRPPVSCKELNTEFVFKRFDLAAESWLDDVESLGGVGEI